MQNKAVVVQQKSEFEDIGPSPA